MKAVILAAGRGTRIDEVTHGLPKCLIKFGDRTILDSQIEGLTAAGISDISIVVGHNATRIVNHVRLRYGSFFRRVQFIYNPEYARTNNIYSLWTAREPLIGSDFICLNADVLCHPQILKAATEGPELVSMVVDPEWRDETMKVIIRNGCVVRMSKGLTPKDASGTYIGFTRFSHEITGPLFDEIRAMVENGFVNQFFNSAVQHLVDGGLRVGVTYTAKLPWAEIDDPSDYRAAWRDVYPLLPWAAATATDPLSAVA
ncbi:MAG: phosphocholine cytidylyltransferase family protein [Bryobacteraceae bacterium]|nr:phosphocholine cytidylyltransferase family protein [Bryobacteraceae bacterium]